MTINDPAAKEIIRLHEQMKTDSANYRTIWDEIKYMVRPDTKDFLGTQTPGHVRNERMFDSTAAQAHSSLSGTLVSDLFNPTERSFGIGVENDAEINRRPDVIEWCDHVSDAIYHCYQNPSSLLLTSAHEVIQDVTAFGNGNLLQEWDADNWQLRFSSIPLASCFFKNDQWGKVDTVSREEMTKLRVLKQKFPDLTWDRIEEELQKTPDKEYCLIHLVSPRADAERMQGNSYATKMPWKSCYVIKEKALLAQEGGYETFPYHTPRWNKVSDEIYGRGPAINCLASLRMLNRMKFTTIVAANKAIDPTTWLPAEGVRLPYKSSAGGVNYYDPSMFPNGFDPKQVEHRGNFPITLELMEEERKDIRAAFYSELEEFMPKKERQSIPEVQIIQARQMRKMAPLRGRLDSELMVPMVQRSFQLLQKAGMIPAHPPALDGKKLRVLYVSSFARAQAADQANSVSAFLQEITPIFQLDPTAARAIDLPTVIQELAIYRRIPRKILNSPEKIAAMEQESAQAEQMAALAGAAEPVSKAMKNVAEAQAIGGVL